MLEMFNIPVRLSPLAHERARQASRLLISCHLIWRGAFIKNTLVHQCVRQASLLSGFVPLDFTWPLVFLVCPHSPTDAWICFSYFVLCENLLVKLRFFFQSVQSKICCHLHAFLSQITLAAVCPHQHWIYLCVF